MSEVTYTPNAGQTYMPCEDNIKVKPLPFTPLARPNPAIPTLELNPAALEKGWILNSQAQHFLPGVTVEMMDWFWVNMEKCYFLWAPGSHKRFNWVREPWKVGFLKSAHAISETTGEGQAVFGGSGVQINRLGLEWFPFTKALDHVIVEGVFNDLGEFVDMTVHMWDSCEGGVRHITASVASTTIHEPPHFIKEMLEKDPHAMDNNDPEASVKAMAEHAEYEASRWPDFLPQMYTLWQVNPDPSQNVACNLTVEQTGEYTWAYTHENGPVTL